MSILKKKMEYMHENVIIYLKENWITPRMDKQHHGKKSFSLRRESWVVDIVTFS